MTERWLPPSLTREQFQALSAVVLQYSDVELADQHVEIFVFALWDAFKNEPSGIFPKREEIEELDRLRRALSTISKPALDETSRDLIDALATRSGIAVAITPRSAIGRRRTPNKPYSAFTDLASSLLPVLDQASEIIQQGLDAKNKNIEGIRAARACRLLWRELTGNAPPKSVSDASPIIGFLAGFLQALGLENDPRSAYAAWIREIEKNPNTQHLLREGEELCKPREGES